MTSNTLNFGPEWMRPFPKSNSNMNLSQAASNISNATQSVEKASKATSSYSSVAATSSLTSGQPGNMVEASEPQNENPNIANYNPFYYSKEMMLSLFKPSDLPLGFESHEHVTSQDPQIPMSFIPLSEKEKKLFEGPINSDITKRIAHGNHNKFNARGGAHQRAKPQPQDRNDSFETLGFRNELTENRFQRPILSLERKPEDSFWDDFSKPSVGTFDKDGVFRVSDNVGESIQPPILESYSNLNTRQNEPTSNQFHNLADQSISDRSHINNLLFQPSLTDQKIAQAFQSHTIDQTDFLSRQLSSDFLQMSLYDHQGRQSQPIQTFEAPQNVPQEIEVSNWYYRDPQGNIQGPFNGFYMHEWYKAGFFPPELSVKRENEINFESLISLIMRLGDDDRPFLSPPSHHPSLPYQMPFSQSSLKPHEHTETVLQSSHLADFMRERLHSASNNQYHSMNQWNTNSNPVLNPWNQLLSEEKLPSRLPHYSENEQLLSINEQRNQYHQQLEQKQHYLNVQEQRNRLTALNSSILSRLDQQIDDTTRVSSSEPPLQSDYLASLSVFDRKPQPDSSWREKASDKSINEISRSPPKEQQQFQQISSSASQDNLNQIDKDNPPSLPDNSNAQVVQQLLNSFIQSSEPKSIEPPSHQNISLAEDTRYNAGWSQITVPTESFSEIQKQQNHLAPPVADPQPHPIPPQEKKITSPKKKSESSSKPKSARKKKSVATLSNSQTTDNPSSKNNHNEVAWQNLDAPKKSLAQIREEEEKERKMNQQNDSIPSKRYVDTVLAQPSKTNAWNAISNSKIFNNPSTKATNPWATVQHPSSSQNKQVNQGNKGSSKKSPKPIQQDPSPEFLKWCHNSLKGLHGINVDDFIQILLSFPLDSLYTVEIIQDTLYTYSPSMDGKSFAEEFLRRRKIDAGLIPNSTPVSSTQVDANSFQLVTKKGRKKK